MIYSERERIDFVCDPIAYCHEWRYELSGHDGLRHCHSCGKSYILIEDEATKERQRFVWARIEEE